NASLRLAPSYIPRNPSRFSVLHQAPYWRPLPHCPPWRTHWTLVSLNLRAISSDAVGSYQYGLTTRGFPRSSDRGFVRGFPCFFRPCCTTPPFPILLL